MQSYLQCILTAAQVKRRICPVNQSIFPLKGLCITQCFDNNNSWANRATISYSCKHEEKPNLSISSAEQKVRNQQSIENNKSKIDIIWMNNGVCTHCKNMTPSLILHIHIAVRVWCVVSKEKRCFLNGLCGAVHSIKQIRLSNNSHMIS